MFFGLFLSAPFSFVLLTFFYHLVFFLGRGYDCPLFLFTLVLCFEADHLLSFLFYALFFSSTPVSLLPLPVSASQLLFPVAKKISAQSFYRSKTEESNSSQMSCQITTSGSEEVNLQSMMKGFEDMFSLDFGRPTLHSGMQVHMQARQDSSVSSCVREGHKINMTPGMGRFTWSEDSE